VRSALLKVRAALPEERKDYLHRLGNAVHVWGPDKGSGDDRSLMQIQKAVVKRRCLTLCYDTGGKGVLSERVVEPLGVIYYGRHWHLIAWCRYREAFRDFRLDRMKEWKVLDETFQNHEDFVLLDFLEKQDDHCDFIPVVIECEPWALERVVAEMPARIQRRVETPGEPIVIEAMAYSLDWLAAWLLGLGTGVKAREPQELCDKILESALKISAKYQDSKSLLT